MHRRVVRLVAVVRLDQSATEGKSSEQSRLKVILIDTQVHGGTHNHREAIQIQHTLGCHSLTTKDGQLAQLWTILGNDLQSLVGKPFAVSNAEVCQQPAPLGYRKQAIVCYAGACGGLEVPQLWAMLAHSCDALA